MDQFEALLAFQEEDMKADRMAAAIKNSPIRQRLEKTREIILDRQKQYKQIEDDIASMTDRKDILQEAVANSEEQLSALQERYESNPPQTEEEVKALMAEVGRCRETIRQYEVEIQHIVKETTTNEKLQRTVRTEAGKAKQDFDQLKAEYDEESKGKKAELEEQRNKVKAMVDTVDPALMAEYETIKKHVSPPVVRLTYGQCSGCNTSLPSATLSKIRNGNLVECETCGRMIIQ